jgi:2-polyprenyl-3-methyl-5-hydroxy-6-metoxy-1,4-benzoquinol methylase
LAELFNSCTEKSEKAAARWGLDTRNAIFSQKAETIVEYLLKAQPIVHHHCPLCHAQDSQIAGRFPGRTYRLCSCGTIILDSLFPSPTEYSRDYFFAEYQKQYGKIYLEDFPKLQKDGERRIRVICSVASIMNNPTAPRLLDIGCAYGPFLAAAKNAGFNVLGIDPASDAIDYIKNSLQLIAIEGTFPESLPPLGKEKHQELFDVITLWYVIEHFPYPGMILAAINSRLKIGGVLAFSTPSAAGISRLKSLRNFLKNSPSDHWTIWNPRRTAAILCRYGFRLKKCIITGHHPERFPFAKTAQKNRGSRFFLALSRIFGLGDTFEAYAVKVKNYEDA